LRCIADITTATDRPFWIKRTEFLECVDGSDFACRDSLEIRHAYLGGWFYRTPAGHMSFNLPAFYLERSIARFINGRHRTALLLQYMEVVPMVLTQSDDKSISLLKSLVSRSLEPDEVFELPDLPIIAPLSTWHVKN
jgi:hypothetical protein